MRGALPALFAIACTGLAPGTDERFADSGPRDAAARDAAPVDGGTDAGACPDSDRDGYTDQACGGLDCDDGDEALRPFAPPVCGDGVRQGCSDPITRALGTHYRIGSFELGATSIDLLTELATSGRVPQLAIAGIGGSTVYVGAVAGGGRPPTYRLYLARLDVGSEPTPVDISTLPADFVPERIAMKTTQSGGAAQLLLVGSQGGAPSVWFGSISGALATGSTLAPRSGAESLDSPALVGQGARDLLAWRVCDASGCELELATYTTAGGVGPRTTRSDPSDGGQLFLSSSPTPISVAHDLTGPVWGWDTASDEFSPLDARASTTSMFSGSSPLIGSPGPATLIATPGAALGISRLGSAGGWAWIAGLGRPGGDFGVLTAFRLGNQELGAAYASDAGRALYLSFVDEAAIAFLPAPGDPAMPLARAGDLPGTIVRIEAAVTGTNPAEIWIVALTDNGGASSLVLVRVTLCFGL